MEGLSKGVEKEKTEGEGRKMKVGVKKREEKRWQAGRQAR